MFVRAVIFVCLGLYHVSAILEDGGVSGDFLEHWNMYPLTWKDYENSEPVQGLHFALYGPDKVQISWMSPFPFVPGNKRYNPTCLYGKSPTNLNKTAVGVPFTYTAGYFTHTLNRVVLDLSSIPSDFATFYYQCGTQDFGFGEVHSFELHSPNIGDGDENQDNLFERVSTLETQSIKAKKTVKDARKVFALIADLGVTHGTDTMQALQDFIHADLVKMIVHVGDISYADNFNKTSLNNSYIWVDYMNEINSFSTWVPNMTCPGNHEAQFNFAAYINWFPMPYLQSSSQSPFWWSFDYMGVHFLSISTEHDFSQSSTQYQFMQNDLAKANQNRDNVPWIVVYGHRPLYCTCTIQEERCSVDAPRFRSYIEDLLYENKVDVYVCGHNHNYERSYPVYKEKAVQKNFENPTAPVYIVNGEAGNPEPNNPSFEPGVEWRANFSGSADNGFLLMVPTKTSLDFAFIRSRDRQAIDGFTITRTSTESDL